MDALLPHRDLAPKDRNGASDPFVRVRYNGRTQETSIVKKSCYPRWNETFEFELEEGAAEALCVEAWDWDLVSRNDFLGKVSAPPLPAAPATTLEPGLHSSTAPNHPPPPCCCPKHSPEPATAVQGPPEATPAKGTVSW